MVAVRQLLVASLLAQSLAENCSAEVSSLIQLKGSTTSSARVYKLLTFNTWWKNQNYAAIAGLIRDINPQIINLQEAIEGTASQIVDALNRQSQGSETWALANPWSADWYWCGLTAYRSDLWEMEWHKEVGIKQQWDTRGVCGSLLRRRADKYQVCVWGTHPIWRNGNPYWARDAIRRSAWAMRECVDKGAPLAFMCDCNTDDTRQVRQELESSVGGTWKLAMGFGYDQIYIQTSPKKVGEYFDGKATCGKCGRKGCQAACSNPAWAYSDHPPVEVSIDTR